MDFFVLIEQIEIHNGDLRNFIYCFFEILSDTAIVN